MAASRQRLDQALVEGGLAESRERAQRLILAGRVRVAGQVSDKPGRRVAPKAARRAWLKRRDRASSKNCRSRGFDPGQPPSM